MYGLDMGLIYKVFYCGMAYCAASVAIPVFFKGKNKSATSEKGKDLEHLKGTDGFILAQKQQLSFHKSIEGVIVIAPPGEHKTTCFAHTQLLSNHFPKNTSLVINDSKGELHRDTSEYQKSIGRKVFLFEPLGKRGHYNPLEFAETYSEVRKLAVDILTNGTLAVRLAAGNGGLNSNDSTWINMATPLLQASLFLHRTYNRPHNTISAAVKFLINNSAETIEDTFADCGVEEAIESFNIFSMSIPKNKDGEVIDSGGPLTSIQTTLATNVTLYLDPKIIEKTSYSDFNYKMLRDTPTALYIKYYPEDSNYLSPLMSIIYSQFIEKCKKYDSSDKNKIVWLLDEMQNLGKIENFTQTVNTSRESRYAFMLLVQSVSALIDIYGRNGTKSILNAMKTKCILPSCSDIEILKELAVLNGDEEILILQNKNQVKMKKNVFTPDEIRRIKSDEVLITAHNLKPILAKQLRYYENDEMLLNKYMGGLK